MKGVAALIGVGIVFLMLGAIMLGLNSFRGASFTEAHNLTSVTLDGATQITYTLANEVLDNHTYNITVISDNALDAPIPYTYTSSTRQLLITGLDTAEDRILTVTYKVPQLDDFTDLTARFIPMLIMLAGIGIVIGAAISAFKRD